jgi:hypothetical protein
VSTQPANYFRRAWAFGGTLVIDDGVRFTSHRVDAAVTGGGREVAIPASEAVARDVIRAGYGGDHAVRRPG